MSQFIFPIHSDIIRAVGRGQQRSIMKAINAAVALAMSLAVVPMAGAQDLVHKAPPQSNTIIIRNATIHTVSGETIENGAMYFSEGIIGGVMTTEELDDLQTRIRWRQAPPIVIDGAGKHVYPGLIGANTATGLVEISSAGETVDTTEVGDVTPEVYAAVAVNPDSTIIPVTRRGGVLTVGVMPSGGAVPGWASVISLEGWTWEDMAVETHAGLLINWPRVRPIDAWWMRQSEEEQLKQAKENLAKIDDVFDAASAYFAARDADPTLATDLRYENLRPVLNGDKPVFISAQELEQIQSAVSWAAERGFRAIIIGGRDSHLCTDLLVKHDVGVMITGSHRMPRRRDSNYDEPFTLPLKLEEAGVRWCLATGGGTFATPHERNLPFQAATCVAYGLDRDAAVRGITLSAAELLGVEDRLGSIEPGKAATIIITSGDPLEITTDVEMAFIDGRRTDLSNKQTDLAEKYREKYRQLGLIEREDEGAAPDRD